METLREEYRMARSNDGAPGIDGVTFETTEEVSGAESFLTQIRDELVTHTYRPMRPGRRRFRRMGARKFVSFRFLLSVIVWSGGDEAYPGADLRS